MPFDVQAAVQAKAQREEAKVREARSLEFERASAPQEPWLRNVTTDASHYIVAATETSHTAPPCAVRSSVVTGSLHEPTRRRPRRQKKMAWLRPSEFGTRSRGGRTHAPQWLSVEEVSIDANATQLRQRWSGKPPLEPWVSLSMPFDEEQSDAHARMEALEQRQQQLEIGLKTGQWSLPAVGQPADATQATPVVTAATQTQLSGPVQSFASAEETRRRKALEAQAVAAGPELAAAKTALGEAQEALRKAESELSHVRAVAQTAQAEASALQEALAREQARSRGAAREAKEAREAAGKVQVQVQVLEGAGGSEAGIATPAQVQAEGEGAAETECRQLRQELQEAREATSRAGAAAEREVGVTTGWPWQNTRPTHTALRAPGCADWGLA
jgi:hypothetical protein